MGGKRTAAVQPGFSIGIEAGGTRTVALLADRRGKILRRLQTGPLNLKLASDAQILSTLRHIHCALTLHSSLFTLHALSICLAGCRTATDRARVRALVARVWPETRCFVGNDLDSGFAAAFSATSDGILVISGTGSCVYGRHGRRKVQVGGWGHLLGDHGSGYWIAQKTLQAALGEFDRTGNPNRTLRKVLRALCLNSPNQLIDWMQQADKADVAALMREIGGDNRAVLEEAAKQLGADCAAAAKKLRLTAPRIALAGGVFANHPRLVKFTVRNIRRLLPRASIQRPASESAYGALLLAIAHGVGGCFDKLSTGSAPSNSAGGRGSSHAAQHHYGLPLTEQRNPRTMDLYKCSTSQLIKTMLDEEARVIPALRANKHAIERAIHAIVVAFKRGGRLFYIGAGTSGRLGVLDASECPPTFSVDAEMVQGIIAGGAPALHTAVEGAEDDPLAGAEAIRNRGVGKKDVVIGIAASANTPFVLGALDEAKRLGAKTFLLCFSPPARRTAHRVLFIATGPEVLTGSTRLKAGTATKLVLNMLTTISMIRLGKVMSNLMVDVQPTNEKLRARACRIVAVLRHCSETEARRRLQQSNWRVKLAVR